MNKRDFYYFFGPDTRRFLRRIYYLPFDILVNIIGKKDRLKPPKGKVFIGSGDFSEQGKRILKNLISLGNLKPDHRVLDIGCGIGRLAVPLTSYLSTRGSYEGFDIVKAGIIWCKKNIEPDFPNFKFIHIDLKNELYNLKTTKKAADFVFSYTNEEFDFVFLVSVFTHMVPEDFEGYLDQISRVLKEGGICFATFFIMNAENKKLMVKNDGIQFNFNFNSYYLHNSDVKEANVAYEQDYLFATITNKGFRIKNCHYGFWPGRPRNETADFQDVLILEKLI